MNEQKSEAINRWLTLKEAAKLIGISPRQLTKRAEDGEIAYKREGSRGPGKRGMYLFAVTDVDAYNSRKRVPASFELETPRSAAPSIPTRIFIDPNDCGGSIE